MERGDDVMKCSPPIVSGPQTREKGKNELFKALEKEGK
jgi:hypothetical protein